MWKALTSNKINPNQSNDVNMKLFRCGKVSIFLLVIALASACFSVHAASTKYAGLIYSGSTDATSKAGIFDLSVSPNRKFNGRITIGSRDARFNGRFDTNGAADLVVKITVDNSCYECDPPIIDIETKRLWKVHFQLSPGGDSLSGSLHFIHGGFPDGTLSGKRSSFNRANQVPSAGKFTFVFAGNGDPANTNFPTGNGFDTMTILPSGTVRVLSLLADQSPFSESTLLCDDGTFPVYASLYNGKGIIQGWVGLTNSSDADLTGDVLWVKPNFAGRAFYPAGFTNDVPVAGSRYVSTKPVLNWTNGVVIFEGGRLSAPFTNSVVLNAHGAIVNVSDNKLTLKIQSSSGRFNGTTEDPLTGHRISLTGVILQKENGGLGFFPNAPLSGQVSLGPAVP